MKIWIILIQVGCALSVTSTKDALSSPEPDDLIPLIIDCDPAGFIATGLDVDDDLALLTAIDLHQKGQKINILGITVTAGNTQLKQSYADALELVRRGIGNQEIPILAGSRWWPPPQERFPGKTVEYPRTEASTFLIETLLKEPSNTVTILCLGPLTNIAAAASHEPKIVNRIGKIVMMGGIIKEGRKLDYNFRFDRTAAARVMDLPCQKILIPVETSVQATFGPKQVEYVNTKCEDYRKNTSNNSPAICRLLTRLTIQQRLFPFVVNRQYADLYPQSATFYSGFILWDVVALFALVWNDMFDDWTYYEINFLSEHHDYSNSKLPARMAMKAVDTATNVNGEAKNILNLRNRTLVPMTLLKEDSLHEVLLGHLFLTPPEDHNVAKHLPYLTWWVSLGLLPLLLGVAVILLFLVSCIAKFLILPTYRRFFSFSPSSVTNRNESEEGRSRRAKKDE